VHDKLTRLRLSYLKSVMLDHFIAKNATAHKGNSYYTRAISYCTFCVGKHTILVPGNVLLHLSIMTLGRSNEITNVKKRRRARPLSNSRSVASLLWLLSWGVVPVQLPAGEISLPLRCDARVGVSVSSSSLLSSKSFRPTLASAGTPPVPDAPPPPPWSGKPQRWVSTVVA